MTILVAESYSAALQRILQNLSFRSLLSTVSYYERRIKWLKPFNYFVQFPIEQLSTVYKKFRNMKLNLLIAALFITLITKAQTKPYQPPEKWHMDGNKWTTGSLVFIAGASKGFNETLMFHWKAFRHTFPKANAKWFNPNESWRNKYKNSDPDAGAKFPLSTSVLVMFTDQYHLNNFVNKMAWTSAFVIKLGEKKKPLKQYLLDFLYYNLCHQAGFALTYYPFKNYKGN